MLRGKNDWMDWDVVWVRDYVGQINHVLDGIQVLKARGNSLVLFGPLKALRVAAASNCSVLPQVAHDEPTWCAASRQKENLKNSPVRDWESTLRNWRFRQVQSHVTQKN